MATCTFLVRWLCQYFKSKFKLGNNLIHHKADYGCTASWNIFATADSKGSVEGIGSEVKRRMSYCTMQKKICLGMPLISIVLISGRLNQ